MAEVEAKFEKIYYREGTTKYVNITCLDERTSDPFDFTGCTAWTWVRMGERELYVPTAIVGNVLSFKIPAELSVGCSSGFSVTRIQREGVDVFSVAEIRYKLIPSEKPDVAPPN